MSSSVPIYQVDKIATSAGNDGAAPYIATYRSSNTQVSIVRQCDSGIASDNQTCTGIDRENGLQREIATDTADLDTPLYTLQLCVTAAVAHLQGPANALEADVATNITYLDIVLHVAQLTVSADITRMHARGAPRCKVPTSISNRNSSTCASLYLAIPTHNATAQCSHHTGRVQVTPDSAHHRTFSLFHRKVSSNGLDLHKRDLFERGITTNAMPHAQRR